ncbi:MAG: cysteine synthase A [Parvularculaceae bacterium]
MARYDNILETIGRTPVVRINKLAPEGVEMFVKIEAFNPLGSVKDRLALGVIEAAEKSGALKPGQTIVEATSGNTGIGLAMVCAQKGYPLVITMVESFSVERRKLMRYLGARVVLTPAPLKGMGMVEKAKELAAKNGWFMTRQFENAANPDIHERTTGEEIVEDFPGGSLDYWVSGYGTGGTLTGVSRVLRRKSPTTKIIVAEPEVAALLSDGSAQARHDDGSASASHTAWTPHPIQGWTPDFVPLITEEAVKAGAVDDVVKVTAGAAIHSAQDLAQQEGIFVGISSGATFAAALEVAKKAKTGARILAMLPDTGERYLSTPLFGDIEAEMSADEIAISKSTPGAQLD